MNDDVNENAKKVLESYVRMQKSRDGKYFQLVVVMPKADGSKRSKYYSQGYFIVKNYVDGKSNSLFLVFKPMVPKDSLKYKFWQKKVALVKKSGVDPNVLG